jgi:predicted PurR-regulated permease PerM
VNALARCIPLRTPTLPLSSPAPNRSPLAEFTYRVLILAAVVALGILAWRLAGVFILVFGGILVAVALRVMTDALTRYTALGKRWALAIVVVSLVAIIGLAGWAIGAQVASQIGELVGSLPDAFAKLTAWLERSAAGQSAVDFFTSATSSGDGALSGLARFAGGTFSVVTDTIIILFVGLFLAADAGLYQRGLLHLFPRAARPKVRAALDASGAALRKWLLGQLSAMIVVGVITFCGLLLLRVPLALSLALIAGLLEFIPFVGPILASIPAILMGFTQGPQEALYVALLYLAINQIEGNVIMPVVQKWAVALPPALGILSVVAFGLLFGIPGVLFAVPLMVVVITLVQKLYVEQTVEAKTAA